jgi:hypothetical protein
MAWSLIERVDTATYWTKKSTVLVANGKEENGGDKERKAKDYNDGDKKAADKSGDSRKDLGA